MSKPNFGGSFQSMPDRRSRVKAALADEQADVDNEQESAKTIDLKTGEGASTKKKPTKKLKREWSQIRTGLNTRIPEDMKRVLDDLVWVRGKEASSSGKPKPAIQDLVTEAIGDFLKKHEALLAKFDLL